MEDGLKLEIFPFHLWQKKFFRAIGDGLGGFEGLERKNSLLLECVETNIKVKGNYRGFIPAKVKIVDGEEIFNVLVVTHQNRNWLIERSAIIHGSFTPDPAHVFHNGPYDPNFCPADKWIIEEGYVYPVVNSQILQEIAHNSGTENVGFEFYGALNNYVDFEQAFE